MNNANKKPYEKGAVVYMNRGKQLIVKGIVNHCRKKKNMPSTWEVSVTFNMKSGEEYTEYIADYFLYSNPKDALIHLIKANNDEIAFLEKRIQNIRQANDYLTSANFQMRFLGELVNVGTI